MSGPCVRLGDSLGGIAVLAVSITLYPWNLRQLLDERVRGPSKALLLVHGSLFIASLQCFYWGFVVPLIRSWHAGWKS
jgi:hypothetical protein